MTDYCDTSVQQCAPTTDATTVILAATLGTAAIVGIIIAIVVVLAVVGGGVAYRYRQVNTNDEAPVQNNPLYRDNRGAGDNPLYNPTQTGSTD